MDYQPMPAQIATSTGQSSERGTHLYGRRLVLARAVWVILAVLTPGILVASFPVYITQLRTVCAGAACAYRQLSPQQAGAFQSLGLSIDGYAAYTVAFVILAALVCFGIGIMIFWRRSDDWMALLFALLFVLGGSIFVSETVEASHSVWRLPNLFLNELTFVFIFLVFSLFPDGRFAPRWTRWLIVVYLAGEVYHLSIVFPDTPLGQVRYPALLLLVWFGELACLVSAQVYRYRRISGPVQRQQTKWVVYSVGIGLTLGVLSYLQLLFPSLNPLYALFGIIISSLASIICPLFMTIAILRHRLWDIDIIINRTLVYGTLTVILTVIYVGLVIGLQALLRGIISQDNSVAIVISTLAIAALFQPLRQHLQRIIDRRFYRSKYDAARTLAAFSATLRNEVDLDELSEKLIAVVQETMEPAHVSLWLRRPDSKTQNQTSEILAPARDATTFHPSNE